MRFALIGQPNCGKSTLFNQVAGYKAETGNFSGTTVTFTESKVRVQGKIINLVDLPGTYTLAGTNPAERESIRYLISNKVDGIIVVMDASRLSNGLELALEVLELEMPTVIALNMVDESRRLGIMININNLQNEIGVPIMPLIASRGQGVKDLFIKSIEIVEKNIRPKRQLYTQEIEKAIQMIVTDKSSFNNNFSSDGMKIKYLEWGSRAEKDIGIGKEKIRETILLANEYLREKRGIQAVWVLSGERHARAMQITQLILKYENRKLSIRDSMDDIFLHPFWGYIILGAILIIFFQLVYFIGNLLENPLINLFDLIDRGIFSNISPSPLITALIQGILQGVSGGAALVLPYLIPFLFGLGLLEDIGYLPRIAFLLDSMMHKIGLHGKAIVPFILGYGCNVPAIMSTRILEDDRDRFIAAAVATLVPCGARLAVVFGLVANYLGPYIAFIIYIFNLFVIAITARILSNYLPDDSPGLLLEMPYFRVPTFLNVSKKAWFRVKEFIIEAWPILMGGSVILALLNNFYLSSFFNIIVRPFTATLGLPQSLGVPLLFGIFRKELSMVMLRQALNVTNISEGLSNVQIITYTVFIVFFVPCVATLVVIRKELGSANMFKIMLLTITIAIITALLARGMAVLFL